MNIFQAIRWSIEAWEEDVTSTTIENCGVKARVLSAKYRPRNLGEENDLDWKDRVEVKETEQKVVTRDIEEGTQNLARQNRISKSIAIRLFFNPQGEEVNDDL